MRKAAFVTQPFYYNNKVFDLSDPTVNRDNCLYSFYLLRKTLAENNIDLSTSDINSIEDSEFVIYNEVPERFPANHKPSKSYALLFETDLIRPINWKADHHQQFHKIFTWNDSILDQKTYIKMNFSHLFPEKIERVPFKERLLCTLIAGNKSVRHPLELYSERLRTIRWFEAHHPDEFQYYGMGWDLRNLGHPFLNKVAKKLKMASWLPARPSPCYAGTVDSKIETLKNYKFSICYENAQQIPGYITEKIFDSFFAGCIPVYWGAPNIEDHIPKECFVDRRDYSSHADLYHDLSNMTEAEFNHRLDAIEDYLNGPQATPFTSMEFSNTILRHVKNR